MSCLPLLSDSPSESFLPSFNLVFSNSDWVRELFQNEGFKVGKKITIFENKFNGNNIRNLIMDESNRWRHLVPKEVIDLIVSFKGIERIKILHERSEINCGI